MDDIKSIENDTKKW